MPPGPLSPNEAVTQPPPPTPRAAVEQQQQPPFATLTPLDSVSQQQQQQQPPPPYPAVAFHQEPASAFAPAHWQQQPQHPEQGHVYGTQQQQQQQAFLGYRTQAYADHGYNYPQQSQTEAGGGGGSRQPAMHPHALPPPSLPPVPPSFAFQSTLAPNMVVNDLNSTHAALVEETRFLKQQMQQQIS